MSTRVQVVIDERERDAFRARAAAEGMSLSQWLREAGRHRLETAKPRTIETVEDLAAFFEACDERERGREPDWSQHLEVIERSRRSGLPVT